MSTPAAAVKSACAGLRKKQRNKVCDGDGDDGRICGVFIVTIVTASQMNGNEGGVVMKEKRRGSVRREGYTGEKRNDFLLFLRGLIVLCFSQVISDFDNELLVFLGAERL